MKKIKVNEEQLREKIVETIREAAEFQRYGGEVQLYGWIEDGEVTEFLTEVFSGHNSWVQGENIVHLYTCRWFDPLADEYMPDWLEGELTGQDELVEEFRAHLREEGLDDEHPHTEWDEFSRKYPELWNEYLEKWREIWIDTYAGDMVDEAIRRLEEDEEIELV